MGRVNKMLERIVNYMKNKKLFQRQRTSPGTIALAVLIYHLGLSYRRASDILRQFEPRSHEAVRKWYHRFKSLFPVIQRKKRRAIAIDETKIKLKGRWYYLWVAIDCDSYEVLAVYLSKARSAFDALRFIRSALKYCDGKPYVYVDSGPWYRWPITTFRS